MEQDEISRTQDSTHDRKDQPSSLELVIAHDLVLSELWDNEQDAEYDRN